MTPSPSIVEILPFEAQLLILERLDGPSLLAARTSCRLWRSLSDKAMEAFYKEVCGSENYAQFGGGNLSLSACCRLNIRIVLAAKEAWNSALKPIQYKKLRPLLAHEMGQPRQEAPVRIYLKGASSPLLFSDEGCRLQKCPLLLKNDSPLTVEVASGGVAFKEFSREEYGAVKEVLQGESGLFLLSKLDSSLVLFHLDSSTLTPLNRTDLGIENCTAQCLTEGRVIVGTDCGEVFDFRIGHDGGLVLAKSSLYSHPVKWVQALPGEGVVCLSGDTLYFSRPGHDASEYCLQEGEGFPALFNGGIVYLKTGGDLVFVSPSSLPIPSVMRTNVSSWTSLGGSALLLTTLEGTLEVISSNRRLVSTEFRDNAILLSACRLEGLVAAAFSSGEVAVFEERGNSLVKIYSTDCFKVKAPVHSMMFSKTLELTVTTRDGGIFSIRPFPNETVGEKEPETLFETLRRLFSFVK
ncbi:F-box protein [Estrella lausannensis]|uniref:F-box domain-containing protein n=1 Tax=Estrella lausannensis TaxID=483423 RepID=A0A0H5E7E7_9BACT|nr:F-box protein [Estrella lausannensis]CRX39260.1 Hypothetical protein ELAC_1936 [Estrella lausannensis]